jgi:hypothetical protein
VAELGGQLRRLERLIGDNEEVGFEGHAE